MNGIVLLLGGGAFLLLGYLFYSKFLARVLGVDPKVPTPAHTMGDGVDYVPAHPTVLFGHHFAAIAGAGPIVGPVLASQFGWAAVMAWILLGCVFVGAMHDMVALFLSARHQGKSIGTIIESVLGRSGKMIFLLFCFATLILVMAEFTRLVAESFVAHPEVATSSLLGIFEAAFFGLCVYRLKWKVSVASLVFVPLLFAIVWAGCLIPCDLTRLFGLTALAARNVWIVVLLVYCFVASTLPVWLLLQPRDYLNAYLLYAMLALGLAGIVFAMPAVNINAFSGFVVANAAKGPQTLFPLLFVTVACGACSGFHALVASGTTSKQLDSEAHIRPVGYGCMLLEGVVALMALVAVAWMPNGQLMEKLGAANVNPVQLFAGGLAGFCGRLGIPQAGAETFMMLAVAAFLMTSVDACTRLARFCWQELWSTADAAGRTATAPRGTAPGFAGAMRNMYVATAVVVALGLVLLVGNPKMAKNLWTMFASANQMLASLTLLTAALWLFKSRRNFWIAFLPMVFMLVTSGTAVCQLFLGNLGKWSRGGFAEGGVTAIGAAVLLLLAVVLVGLGLARLRALVKERAGRAARK
ncbi:MAG: carbon starvation protein A [Kiritimatiellia bacterium]